MLHWLDALERDRRLPREGWLALLRGRTPELAQEVFARARRTARRAYGTQLFVRGLIEISNICKNDCYYCGIRRSNAKAERYRLAQEDILACCREGYGLGFRTFVLQGGEDPYYRDERLCALVEAIKARWPDCAVTLSMGERSRESYRLLRRAGADRYLLRHETADGAHYARLHPPCQTLENRKRCLWDLKELGYQVGSGFMVGSPDQSPETLAEDLAFLTELQPQMVGIGPFIPHRDTPFAACPAGSVEETLYLLGLIRLLLPGCLLPATTALNTLDGDGRRRGVLAGANVVMPNLSPQDVRGKYLLYDNKAHEGCEAAQAIGQLRASMEEIGYTVAVSRGDAKAYMKADGEAKG